jgi:type I restriction enzyme, S subunit
MKGFPDGWSVASLGEIASKIGSGATPTGGKTTYQTSGIPLIRSMNVHFSGFTSEGLAYINEQQAKKLDNVTVHPGDVLLNITGASIGRVTIAPPSMNGARVNQHVAIIRLVEGIESKFVSGFLSSPTMQSIIAEENYGVTRQALTKSMIEQFHLPVPPLPEQRRIVAKIDSLSAKSKRACGQLDHIPRLVEKYKQAILTAAFRGDLTTEWREHRPATWTVTTIGGIANVASGHTPKGIEEALQPNGEISWFKVSSMNEPQNQQNLVSSQFRLSRTAAQQLGLRIFPAGTMAFPKRGGAIATNKKRRLGVDAALDLNLMALVPHAVRPNFLWWWMQGLDLASISNGSNVPQINHGDVAPLPISLPSDDEQDEIDRRVSRAFLWVDRLASEATNASKLIDHLDKAILAKAFRGELVPQDIADEPASKVLERIRAERSSGHAERANRRRGTYKPRSVGASSSDQTERSPR